MYPNHPFVARDTASSTASTATPADEPGRGLQPVQAAQICDSSVAAAYRHSYTSAAHAKPSEPAHASASGSHLAFTPSQVVVVAVVVVAVVVVVVAVVVVAVVVDVVVTVVVVVVVVVVTGAER